MVNKSNKIVSIRDCHAFYEIWSPEWARAWEGLLSVAGISTTWAEVTWLWRWLPLRIQKRQSLTAYLRDFTQPDNQIRPWNTFLSIISKVTALKVLLWSKNDLEPARFNHIAIRWGGPFWVRTWEWHCNHSPSFCFQWKPMASLGNLIIAPFSVLTISATLALSALNNYCGHYFQSSTTRRIMLDLEQSVWESCSLCQS